MEKYQTIQLEAASKILEILGLPCPHSLEERIKVIEASQTVLDSRLEGSLKNYCIAMQEVTNEIMAGRSRQKYSLLLTQSR